MTEPMLLDERIRPDGSLARSWGTAVGGRLRLVDDDGADGELSMVAIDRVMVRYGKPLDEAIGALTGPALELAEGAKLRRFRYHTPVDATGRDYLVWERADREPVAVVATMATAALRYLVMRLADERPQETET